MQISDSPRKVALLVLLVAALVVAVVWRVRPGLVRGVFTSGDGKVTVGRFEVPHLPEAPAPVAGRDQGWRRNLFTFGAPPTPTPDLRPTPTPVRIPTATPGPPPPTPTPPGILLADGTRLPPPPPFPLPYLGWLGPRANPVAVFRDGNDVLVAPQGAVVMETFVVREVGPTAVTIGYLGYPETVTTQVPLAR